MVKDRNNFSPSRLNYHEKCPRMYEYRDSDFFTPVSDNTALIFGSAVHKGIFLYNGSIKEPPTSAEIRSTAEQEFKNAWDSRLSGRFKGEYEVCKNNFMNFELWRLKNGETPFKPEICEKNIVSEKFHARLDWFHHGRIIDWKTNKDPILRTSDQLEVWTQAEVLTRSGFKVNSIQLFFLKHNQPMNIEVPNFIQLYQNRQKVLDAIKANYFPPNVTILCHWCGFKLRCEYSHIKERNYSERKYKLWNNLNHRWRQKIIPQRTTHEPEW